jgi:DNA-binding winged helix-turn-helix (wHTH) protein
VPTTPLIKIGEFSFDLPQSILYLGQTELAAEPKVIELLVYLYQHRERYVGMEELHQEVWRDRVVSDTAVRGTIKKLRALLGDTDLTQARYIKSVSKKGYKLICAIGETPSVAKADSETSDEFSQLTATPDQQLLNVSGGYAAEISPRKESKFRRHPSSIILILMLFILIFSLSDAQKSVLQHFTQTKVQAESRLLSHFPGEKYSLTTSSDGRYIAFTGRTSVDQDRQVYLLDNQTNQIKQVTQTVKNAMLVAFVNNNTIAYSNNSTLYLQTLDATQSQAPITLLAEVYAIVDIKHGPSEDELLVNIQRDKDASAMYFTLNTKTLALNRLATVNSSDEHYYQASLSPNKQLLALAKVNVQQQHQLLVVDIITNKLVTEMHLSETVDSLAWHDNNQLMVLDQYSIALVNIHTQQKTPLLANKEGLITALTSINGADLLLLKSTQARANRHYVEQDIDLNPASARLIQVENNVSSMFYSTHAEQKWITLLQDNIYSLARFDPEGKQHTVFQTNKAIEILDESPAGMLLLKIGGQLVTVTPATGEINYLTRSHQLISDAVFTHDGRHILFGQRVANTWEIEELDLLSLTSKTLLTGYRAIRTIDQGYVIANAQGELSLLHDIHSQPEMLNHSIDYTHFNRWHTRNNKIIWTTFDFHFTYLHQLDLYDRRYTVNQERFLKLYPRVSVNAAGDRVLYLSTQVKNVNIEAIGFDSITNK